MKSVKYIVGLLIVFVLVVVPFSVKALEGEFTNVGKTCATPDADGYCETTVYLRLKLSSESESFSTFSGTIALKDSSSASGIKDVVVAKALEGINISTSGDIASGISVKIVNSSAALSATSFTNVFKVTYKHLASMTTDCGLSFTGKDITTETKIVENVQTGAALPYAILAVAAVGAIGAYVATNKKSKLRKI